MNKLLIASIVAVAVATVAACKEDKKLPPYKGPPETTGSVWQQTCTERGGDLTKVFDLRETTCVIPMESFVVEIDKEDPWFEKKPDDVVNDTVKDEKEVTYASDWDKEKVQKLDAKEIKVNPVQEKKIEVQKAEDVAKYGPEPKEIIAHAPNKEFKTLCDSKSGTFSKIHGGKWVCRYKE